MKHSLTQLIGKFFHRIIPVFLLTLIACNEEGELIFNNGSSVVYMWVSSTSTDGDIGGVNGATAICETDASGIGGLALGLTHRAVIATSTNDPRNYFSNNLPVQRPDGTVITDTYADFFADLVTLTNTIGTGYYWTGLDRDGSYNSSNTCNDWTSASSSVDGAFGGAVFTNTDRLIDSPAGCNRATNKVLCVSN